MSTVQRPSGWDTCCAPARTWRDFARGYPDALTTEELWVLLQNYKIGVDTIVLFQVLILSLVLLGSLVPGFALFDGAAGEASAISHIGFFAVIELAIIYVGAKSTGFGLHLTADNSRIEKGVARTKEWLNFYWYMLIVAIVAHITHFVLALIENANCTSTLCVDNRGFLIALIVFLITMAVVLAWQMYRVAVYARGLHLATGSEKIRWTMTSDGRQGGMLDDDDESPQKPSAPPYNLSDGLAASAASQQQLHHQPQAVVLPRRPIRPLPRVAMTPSILSPTDGAQSDGTRAAAHGRKFQ